MSWIGRRRLHASAAAVFATLMLAALALIARDGLTGATGRMVFGLELLLWSVSLSGFPFLLMAGLSSTIKRSPRVDVVAEDPARW